MYCNEPLRSDDHACCSYYVADKPKGDKNQHMIGNEVSALFGNHPETVKDERHRNDGSACH